MNLARMRVAVAGMGRSGLAIAKACAERGARATVFDERLADTEDRIGTVERLQGMGAEVVTGWHGRLEAGRFEALVVSPGFRREHPVIRDALAAGIEVLSEVEFAYRISPNPIVAITGTNGKSTTTVLTWTLLAAAGKDAVLCGNIAGSGYPEMPLTEAALLTGEPGRVLVAEVSSFQLEWVSQFRPRAAAITNVTPDHLDRHPSFEDYRATKFRIFAAQGEGDVAVVNESEPSLPADLILPAIPREVAVRSFAMTPGDARQHGHAVLPSSYRDGPDLVLGGIRVSAFDLPLVGEYNLANAMMAWELATGLLGTPDEATQTEMLRAIAGFRGLEHRMERLGERGGVLVVNNSMCTNPAAVVASSSGLARRQHIVMGGFTKNLDYTPVREYLARTNHVAYVMGEDSELARQLGVDRAYPSLEAAFEAAVSSSTAGEAILLAPGCMSTAPFRDFRERGAAFKRLAEAWLAQEDPV